MPGGIPVATVGINNAKNAGLLALRILATNDDALTKQLSDYKEKLKDEVLKKAEKVEKGRSKIGFRNE